MDNKSALVKGEIHRNQKDREDILSYDLNSFDAIFVEERDNSLGYRKSPIYNLYAVGYVVYVMMVLPVVDYLMKAPKKLNPFSKKEVNQEDFRSKLVSSEAVFEDGSGDKKPIDADISRIFDFLGKSRYTALLLSTVLIGYTVYKEDVIWPLFLIPCLVFAISVILVLMKEGSRNKYMAENIEEISREKDYEKIMIICGDRHAPEIQDLLDKAGFDTRLNRSESRLGQIFRKLFRD